MVTDKADDSSSSQDDVIYEDNISFVLDMTNCSVTNELHNEALFAKTPEEFGNRLNKFYASKSTKNPDMKEVAEKYAKVNPNHFMYNRISNNYQLLAL